MARSNAPRPPDLLTNGVLLQAELSDGEMDEAMLIRLKSMPLGQDIESGPIDTDFFYAIMQSIAMMGKLR